MRKSLKVMLGTAAVLLVLIATTAVTVGILNKQNNASPVLTLTNNDSPTKVYFGEKYQEPGYKAKSSTGKDITSAVTTKYPDMSLPGTYTVRYTVKDRNGKSVSAKRTVKVVFHKQTKAGKERGLAVLMYHKVYDDKNPPKTGVDANCVSTSALREELKYLVKEGYYFPTWKQVRSYLDGKIDLPEKSVVLTFDDGSDLFLKYGVPLLEKYDVHATAFIIASRNGKSQAAKKYKHIEVQSHSFDMHKAGGKIGHGGIFTALTLDEGVKDLKKSIEVLGNGDAFAYPFGDYTDTCKEAVKKAGFLVAFTTNYGKIHPGDDPYLLSRVRVNGSPSLDTYKTLL